MGILLLKAVVFDLDGTITKLILPLEDMRQDTKTFFITKGLPPHLIDPADGISSTKHKALKFFKENGITSDEWNSWCEELDFVLDSHETDVAHRAELIDGSLDAVKRIRSLRLKTAILTNSGRLAVDVILNRIPLESYFDLIQTRSESSRPKPFPDGILEVVEKLGVRIDEALYIGDANIDAVASCSAGIQYWGVTTGETQEDILLSSGAMKVFKSLDEVYYEIERSIK